MNNNLSEAIRRLPKDWWKTMSMCDFCSKTLKGHTLGLFLSGEIFGSYQEILFSGFPFQFEDTLVWLTAGHVIDGTDEVAGIKTILSNSSFETLKGRWLDWEEMLGAESIPVNLKGLYMFSGWNYGLDFGMSILNPLEKEIISRNTNSLPFTSKHWSDLQDFQPEGYYLLGFPNPEEQTTIKQTQIDKRTLICLPIERVPFSKDFRFENPDTDAFYGKILDFPDAPEIRFNVPGMSGGPIIGIKRDPVKGMDFRLYGIQSKWLRESRIIKAEPIERVIDILNFASRNQE